MRSFLIDSSIYIFRSYFTLPDNWKSLDSHYSTNAVYGFTSFLLNFLKQTEPNYLGCAFDESLGSGFRHEIFPSYKANRELPDDGLAYQLNACRQLCRVLGICEVASDIYEADDLIGSMARTTKTAGMQPVIVSRDKDLMQLVEDNVLYWDFGKSHPQNKNELEDEIDINCSQLSDFLALTGDSSDNIPGVQGIGMKTARQLLSYFPNVESIIEHLDHLQDLPIRGAGKLADKLGAVKDQILLSKRLATIVTEIDEAPVLCDLAWKGVQMQAFEIFADEMGFGNSFEARVAELKQRTLSPLPPQIGTI
jgi:5'-3' exonuclease